VTVASHVARYRRCMEDSLDLIVPPELESGVYADWLNPSFTRHQITLDFGAPLFEEELILTARVRVR
jgi:hypothetical protein